MASIVEVRLRQRVPGRAPVPPPNRRPPPDGGVAVAAHNEARPRSASAVLGHAQSSTTLNLYGHALYAPTAAAAGKLEQDLARPAPARTTAQDAPTLDGAAGSPTAGCYLGPAGGAPARRASAARVSACDVRVGRR